MRKLVILFLLLPLNVYSQSVVRILGNLSKASRASISRTITVPRASRITALEVLQSRHYSTHTSKHFSVIEYNVNLKIHSLKTPNTIYGPYNYMRAIFKVSKQPKFVDPNYIHQWNRIQESQGYNGVHHLVTKNAIKDICAELNCTSTKLKEVQSNAPCIFHPLHGNPNLTDIFHNSQEQFMLYQEKGMKAVVLLQLDKLNELNRAMGLKDYPDWYREGILKETKLWCEIYKFRFE